MLNNEKDLQKTLPDLPEVVLQLSSSFLSSPDFLKVVTLSSKCKKEFSGNVYWEQRVKEHFPHAYQADRLERKNNALRSAYQLFKKEVQVAYGRLPSGKIKLFVLAKDGDIVAIEEIFKETLKTSPLALIEFFASTRDWFGYAPIHSARHNVRLYFFNHVQKIKATYASVPTARNRLKGVLFSRLYLSQSDSLHLAVACGLLGKVQLLTHKNTIICKEILMLSPSIPCDAWSLAVWYRRFDIIDNWLETGKVLLNQSVGMSTFSVGRGAFLLATIRKDVSFVHYLLKKGLDVNPNVGRPLLIEIAMMHRSKIFGLVKSLGGRFAKQCWNDMEYPDAGVLTCLIKHGANVNELDHLGNSALIIAAKNGYVNMVKLLIEERAHVNESNQQGETALMMTAKSGSCDIASYLIQSGATLNQKNNHGETAVFYAVRSGNVHMLKYLHQLGAKMDQENDYGDHLLECIEPAGHNALEKYLGHNVIAKYLIEECHASVHQLGKLQKARLLHYAVQFRNFPLVKRLVKAHVYLDKVKDEMIPLMIAVKNNDIEMVKILATAGANINQITCTGERLLMYAIRQGMVEMADILLHFKAKVRQVNCKGETPLMVATRTGNVTMVDLMLYAGAALDIYRQNHKRETPFMIAQRYKHFSIMELFVIKTNAFSRLTNNQKQELLLYAAKKGHLGLARCLLRVNAVVCRNQLLIAVKHKHYPIVAFFLSVGAQVDALSYHQQKELKHYFLDRGRESVNYKIRRKKSLVARTDFFQQQDIRTESKQWGCQSTIDPRRCNVY